MTTESTNKAHLPGFEKGETAPVAPASTETKAADASGDLPPIIKEPLSTAEAHMVPSVSAQSKTETTSAVPVPVPEPASTASAVDTHVQEKIEEIERLASQPEKPGDTVAMLDSQPVNVEGTAPVAIPNGEPPKHQSSLPKPVTIEEVQDKDMPLAKPMDSPEPLPNKEAAADIVPVADGPKDDDKMTGALQTEASPAKTEEKFDGASVPIDTNRMSPEVGDKRKADIDVAPSSVIEDSSKKQKANGASSNGSGRKPGRPRKEKKTAAPVGRTARKTRSQGAAE